MHCTTCHDPHRSHTGKSGVAHYRKSCLQCHEKDKGCKVSASERVKTQPDDSCVACHMPRRALSPRLASGFHGHGHDHRIVRNKDKSKPASLLSFSVPRWWPEVTQAKLEEHVKRRAIALARWRSVQPVLWLEKAIDQKPVQLSGDVSLVREALANTIRPANFDPSLSQALAEIDLLSGKNASALPFLNALVKANPSNTRARLLLAFAQWKSKQPAAVATIAEAVKLASNRSGPLLLQARILQDNGDLTKAIKAAEKAILMNPRRWAIRRWLAEAYRLSKNKAGELRQRAFLKRVGR